MLHPAALKIALSSLGCLVAAGYAVNTAMAPMAVGPAALPAADARQYSDEEVRLGFSRRAQLAFPAKLAVYEQASPNDGYGIRDNETIEEIVKLLGAESKLYQTVVLAPPVVQGDGSLIELRRAAAAHRADLTLLLRSEFRIHTWPSVLSVLDLTILGAYLLPTWGAEVESRVTAHLVDTRNGLIYHSAVRQERWEGSVSFARRGSAVDRHRRELALQNLTEAIEDVTASLPHAERLAKEPVADPPAFDTWSAAPRRPDPPAPAPAPPARGALPDGVRYDTGGQ